MAGELIRKVKELQKLVVDKSNREFKKKAIELVVADAVDEAEEVKEDIVPVIEPEEPEEDQSELPTMDDIKLRDYCLEAILHKSIAEEEEAAAIYVDRAREAFENNEIGLEALFVELASDELVHSASLKEALKIYGIYKGYLEAKGKIEVGEILNVPSREILKEALEQNGYTYSISEESLEAEEEKLLDQAEKERKAFDFVQEYVKNHIKYHKEKVVNAINDLISGKSDLAYAVAAIMKDGEDAIKAHKQEQRKGTEKEVKKDEK